MIRCPRCPATWTGLKPEHCPACHQTFAGTTIGDQHRPVAGPCLTVEEMREKGWREVPCSTGHLIWRGPEVTEGSRWWKQGDNA